MPESHDTPPDLTAADQAAIAAPCTPPGEVGWVGDNTIEALIQTVKLACEDDDFRAQCLRSPADAKAAVRKAGHIAVPDNMNIIFIERFPEPNAAIILLPPKGSKEVFSLRRNFKCCYQPYVS